MTNLNGYSNRCSIYVISEQSEIFPTSRIAFPIGYVLKAVNVNRCSVKKEFLVKQFGKIFKDASFLCSRNFQSLYYVNMKYGFPK